MKNSVENDNEEATKSRLLRSRAGSWAGALFLEALWQQRLY